MTLQRGSFEISGPLVPEPTMLPPAIVPRGGERVLHVALDTPTEKQPSLRAALATLGEYRNLDWVASEKAARLPEDMLAACREFKPSLVFMQLQRSSPVQASVIDEMRKHLRPDGVVLNWDGDYHHEPDDAHRAWFVDLGRACDASLVTMTHHQKAYAALGVQNPGYFQIGVDDRHFVDSAPPVLGSVVILAGRYQSHDRRNVMIERFAAALPGQFAVYGRGWKGRHARPFVQPHDEPPIYRGAAAALSISRVNDAPRYTSDRLFRGLAAGGVMLVERFPDMEGLGLSSPGNCFAWSAPEQLIDLASRVLGRGRSELDGIRAAARAAASELHTWRARMPELMAIAEEVRRRR